MPTLQTDDEDKMTNPTPQAASDALEVLNAVFPANTVSFTVNGEKMKSDSGCTRFVPLDDLVKLTGHIGTIRALLTAAAQPATEEPWYGHEFKRYPDGTWRCDKTGKVLYEAQPADDPLADVKSWLSDVPPVDQYDNINAKMEWIFKNLKQPATDTTGEGVKPEIIGFLLGENDFDGHSFGETPLGCHAFWWRKPLRDWYAALLSKPAAVPYPPAMHKKCCDSVMKAIKETGDDSISDIVRYTLAYVECAQRPAPPPNDERGRVRCGAIG